MAEIDFVQANEDLDRSALLIAKALADDEECIELWQAIYAVTSFFAGAISELLALWIRSSSCSTVSFT